MNNRPKTKGYTKKTAKWVASGHPDASHYWHPKSGEIHMVPHAKVFHKTRIALGDRKMAKKGFKKVS